MSDKVKIECNTQEDVAFRLMIKILGNDGKSISKDEILKTYYECLMVVKGFRPSDLIED